MDVSNSRPKYVYKDRAILKIEPLITDNGLTIKSSGLAGDDQAVATEITLQNVVDYVALLVGDLPNNNPMRGYTASREDTSGGAIVYYGMLKNDGQWVVIKHDETNAAEITYKYFQGASNFATGWSGRAGHTYVEFSSLIF